MSKSHVWRGETPELKSRNVKCHSGGGKHHHHHSSTVKDGVSQKASVQGGSSQESYEEIVIKGSVGVNVFSLDINALVTLQAGLQAAIPLLLELSLADGETADKVAQELMESLKSEQISHKKVYIEHSNGVNVFTTNTDIVVNIQLLVQLLIVLALRLDIL